MKLEVFIKYSPSHINVKNEMETLPYIFENFWSSIVTRFPKREIQRSSDKISAELYALPTLPGATTNHGIRVDVLAKKTRSRTRGPATPATVISIYPLNRGEILRISNPVLGKLRFTPIHGDNARLLSRHHHR